MNLHGPRLSSTYLHEALWEVCLEVRGVPWRILFEVIGGRDLELARFWRLVELNPGRFRRCWVILEVLGCL